MAVLCGMPTIQNLVEALGICVLAIYFLHSTRPSVPWLNSRSSLVACDWLMSALSTVPSTRVRSRRKFGEVSCTDYGVCRPAKICQGQLQTMYSAGAPARFQARVGKDLWRKFGAKRRKNFFSLPTLVFGLPTLDLIAWVGKDPPAVLNKS